jgi:uncharacterized protein (DUF2235 family)
MSTKIVLFSDGTGNSSAKAQKTNVWRLFQALNQRETSLIAKYDDGVGTSSNKYLATLGGAFGFGLKRNVIDLYKFVCRNHQKHDEIYGFGFSRGAFTIRVLVGLIAREGLVPFRTEEELDRNARAAYRDYRSKAFPFWSPIVIALRWLRDVILRIKDWIKDDPTYAEVHAKTVELGRSEVRIKFLGLWDTVEAYGIPIAELKRGIDWVLWPMVFGDYKLSPKVDRACHALSLDDERTTFHPLLWDEAAEAELVKRKEVSPGRITQVWFAGVHSNVGGGYPEDRLSLVPLEWIMSEAKANGLPLDEARIQTVAAECSPYARLYDSRAGFAAYYHYDPRRIPIYADHPEIRPMVHGSVVMRMAHGSDQYAPIILPHEFWIVAPDGELLPMTGFPEALRLDSTKKKMAMAAPQTKREEDVTSAKARLKEAMAILARPASESVGIAWDTVWCRRLLYAVTMLLIAVLVSYPWTKGYLGAFVPKLLHLIPVVGKEVAQRLNDVLGQADVGSRGFISPLVDAISGLLPSYATPWTNAFLDYPIEFGSITIVILLCLYGSTILQERIHDRARLAWHSNLLPQYRQWMGEMQTGARRALVLAFVVAALVLIANIIFEPPLAQIETGVIVGILLLVLIWQNADARRLSPGETSPNLRSTVALSIARKLRTNDILVWLYRAVFKVVVPIAFAVGLIVVGADLGNRVLFDAWSAAGQVCVDGVEKKDQTIEKTGRATTSFMTNNTCWPSGLVLNRGHRYRITLTTSGDWRDHDIPTDVNGFASHNLNLLIGLPMRRWWTQNWFKPIAQIGKVGNDQYMLGSPDTTESSTPGAANKVVTEIVARSDGELFIFVNDAVVMIPGLLRHFYENNQGTGTITVERIGN